MQQRQWLKEHGIEWDQDGKWRNAFDALPAPVLFEFHKTFNRAIQTYLDTGYGSCVLKDSASRKIAEDAIRHFHTERFWQGDFVVMPNHVHARITPIGQFELDGILKSVKRFSSRNINEARGSTGNKGWQKESHDHIVRSLNQVRLHRRYVAENPTKAKLRTHEYSYHRAPWMDTWFE